VTSKTAVDEIASVPFSRRVLLLPHCLRPSQDCPGKMTRQGLDCTGCSLTGCTIYKLRTVAAEAGYSDVCVAPGGRLAVRFLAERQPAGVIAIACNKELEEGLEAIARMEWDDGRPAVFTFPLSQDGCVDTKVDVEAAREIILSNGHLKR
jgi:geranylgeranyl diphosphate synthase type II